MIDINSFFYLWGFKPSLSMARTVDFDLGGVKKTTVKARNSNPLLLCRVFTNRTYLKKHAIRIVFHEKKFAHARKGARAGGQGGGKSPPRPRKLKK